MGVMINYYGQSKETYNKIKPLIQSNDAYNMTLIALTTCILLFILYGVGSVIPFASQFKGTYLRYAILLLGFNILIRLIKRGYKMWIYLLLMVLLSLSISLTLVIPHQPATIFPIVLMIIPLLFTVDFYSVSVVSIVSSVVYILLVHVRKQPEMAAFDTYNVIVLLVISLIIRYLIQRQHVSGMCLKLENQHLINCLKHDVDYDNLTNLLNRKALVRQIVGEHTLIKETYGVLGILDIDSFKDINDTYGHQQGDLIIKKIATILKASLEENDVIGRLGGDEFIFCLVKRASIKAAQEEIEAIIQVINQVRVDTAYGIGVSIGIVALEPDRLSFMEAYKKADLALYSAKSTGKNKVRQWNKAV